MKLLLLQCTSPLMGWPGRAQRPNLLDCGWEA